MNNKGFTLIELVATISLLGVLAIISFVSITGILSQSKVNDCENLVNSIKSAAKEYVSDNRYNNSFDSDNDKVVEIEVFDLISGDYLSGPVMNPFDNSQEIDSTTIIVKIELNNDYTAKNITIEAPTILNNCKNGI